MIDDHNAPPGGVQRQISVQFKLRDRTIHVLLCYTFQTNLGE